MNLDSKVIEEAERNVRTVKEQLGYQIDSLNEVQNYIREGWGSSDADVLNDQVKIVQKRLKSVRKFIGSEAGALSRIPAKVLELAQKI